MRLESGHQWLLLAGMSAEAVSQNTDVRVGSRCDLGKVVRFQELASQYIPGPTS